MGGPEVAEPEAGNLPQRDRATYRATVRATPAPVPRELALRIVRGFYPDWNLWTLGCFYVAAPEGADALTDPSVVSAGSMAELIAMIAETAAGAR